MKTTILVLSLAMGLSQSLWAQKLKKPADVEPYGMAGCGVGSIFIDKNETFPQLGVSSINALGAYFFIGNQTLAISFGTSNCVEKRTRTAAMEQEVFITANLNTLKKEASSGTGEHLEGLAEVLGCRNEEEKVRLVQVCQEEYGKIFTTQEPNTVLENILSAIQSDEILRTGCKKAS